jgi:NADH-quinone oxidoreductase subunit L
VITALHHQQDIFCMGGLKQRLPLVYWPFLGGALCLAGFPGSGGFFSKDAILGVVFEKGGVLYGGLFALGLFTALLTSFYTFRMLFVVFHGESQETHPLPDPPLEREGTPVHLPAVMTLTLIPLAVIGLLGGVLNLPEYFGVHGLLTGFLGSIAGFSPAEHGSASTEISLQIVAATACIIGLGLAWSRYTGDRRASSLATESGQPPLHIRFLQSGWMLDDLYRLLFIRPFVWLARVLWKTVDEAGIDGTVDGLSRLTVRLGRVPASWSTGRVATTLFGIAGGVAVVLVYLVWSMAS